MKIRPVGAELFHKDEQTERHDDRFAVMRKRLKYRLLIFMSYSHPLSFIFQGPKVSRVVWSQNTQALFFFG